MAFREEIEDDFALNISRKTSSLRVLMGFFFFPTEAWMGELKLHRNLIGSRV